MARYVVSLGGNALGNNSEEQKKALIKVADAITDLIIDNNEVAIVHGNGPQVGMIKSVIASATLINAFFCSSLLLPRAFPPKETTYLAMLISLCRPRLRHHLL